MGVPTPQQNDFLLLLQEHRTVPHAVLGKFAKKGIILKWRNVWKS